MRTCEKYRFVGRKGVYKILVHRDPPSVLVVRDGVARVRLAAHVVADIIDAVASDVARNGVPAGVAVLDIKRPPPDAAGPPRPTVEQRTFDQQYNGAPLTGKPCAPAGDDTVPVSDLRIGDSFWLGAARYWVAAHTPPDVMIVPACGGMPVGLHRFDQKGNELRIPRKDISFIESSVPGKYIQTRDIKPGSKVRVGLGWASVTECGEAQLIVTVDGRALTMRYYAGKVPVGDVIGPG